MNLAGKSLGSLNLAGANFAGAILGDASLALANLRGAALTNLREIVDGTGAVVAASVESLKEALGGAVYDEFTRFNAAQAATLQAAMAPFKLDEVFESGARGPLFAFQGGLEVGANGIRLNLNLQVNIDVELARRFEMSATDLPAVAQELVPSFSLSGLASSRLVTALNVDMGIDLAKGTGPGFSVDSESWLRLNRFDAGVRVAVTDLEASLNVAGLADVQVKKGTVDLRAAAQVALTDPDNSDGLERLTSTERGSSSWSEFVELTTTSNLRGQMTLNASGESVALAGIPDLTLAATGLQVDVNLVSGVPVGMSPSSRVVDFGSRPLNISTGAGTEIELNLDGGDGELMRASGALELTVGEFCHVAGDLSIEKSTRSLKLSNGKTTSLDVLSIAGVDLQAFAGFGGDQPVGLTLNEVNFGLALLSDPNAPEKTYTALTATASNAAFVGLPSLVAQGADLSVEINRGTAAGVVVDFAAQPLVLTVGGQAITTDVEVDINRASIGEVLDFSAEPLVVATGPGRTREIDFRGSLGRLTRARATLDVNLFDFFSVNGDFEFEQSQGSVKLSDGSTINADLMTLGGNEVNAFAGIKFGDGDQVGVSLGGVNFGLAFIVDQADASHQFTSLQATADSASFSGIDLLHVAARDLEVAMNRGIHVPATPAATEAVNAVYHLDLFRGTVGELTFKYDDETRTLTLLGDETDAVLRSNLTSTIGGFTGIGAANVTVTGDKVNGFRIEFVGGLAGENVDSLMVSISEPTSSTSVVQTVAAAPGQTEIKYLTFDLTQLPPLPVGAEVVPLRKVQWAEVPPTVATTNTVYNVVIHDGTLGTVAFHWAGLNRSFTLAGAETDEQVRNAIATAVGGFRGIGGANVSVTGTKAAGFQIEFLNDLSGRDITGLTVSTTAPEATAATAVARPADAGRNEIQTITFTVQPQATDLPATVETIQAAALGTGDVFAIDFTSPYSSKGLYKFHLGRYWYKLRFVNNDVDNNQRYIREGLAWLLGTSTDNVWVKFDQDSSGSHRYFVKLTGELAGQSIRGLSVIEDFRGGGTVVIVPPSAGVSGRVALGRGRFVQAGGDVHVVGSATVGDAPVPTQRPIITTVPRTIQVVTGTRQVAVGAVDMPLVSFVTTTTTEEVGRERVRVGSYFNTADITLVQTGYYNATTNTHRVLFVEDVDWSNTDPTINWLQKYDASGRIVSFPTGSAPPADWEWGQLFPEQRDAVLIHLGYRTLYNVEFNNLWRNQTVNGIPSRVAWHPAWENDYTWQSSPTTAGAVNYKRYNSTSGYHLNIAGWNDKYVILPQGIDSDTLRLVSQGEPVTYQEYVGSYYDTATVSYTQDRSSLTDGFNANDGFIDDADNSSARWRVNYYSSGVRHYVLSDSFLPSEAYYPQWASASSEQTGVIDLPIAAPSGYIGETDSVSNQTLWYQTLQTVGTESRHHSE